MPLEILKSDTLVFEMLDVSERLGGLSFRNMTKHTSPKLYAPGSWWSPLELRVFNYTHPAPGAILRLGRNQGGVKKYRLGFVFDKKQECPNHGGV